ncbi:SGNH/GDSL hydrolase family protein [Nonomuraea soli]|uniref:Fibronectin type 3 domain-containing protein n=1 Tax=Nonomuraea soli TaxID=1032476 RepID=A0A7W0CME1_9ACTN|nr:SGNH/GDSL hydrolase family protein [Nonomuraea soli]MBA2893847.1 fibronectin type 3 domain-containing protein [Nonomuraea soli]
MKRALAALLLTLTALVAAPAQADGQTYDFGSTGRITPTTAFADGVGFTVLPTEATPEGSAFVNAAGATFSLELPDGDYTVDLKAGDAAGATDIAVGVESVAKVQQTAKGAGEFLEMSFSVALVDGRMDFAFSGTAPKIDSLVVTRQPARTAGTLPTVYIAGDSTVQTYDPYWAPEAGWGQMIDGFFGTAVAFDNRAIGGRSSKNFLTQGRLDEILRAIRPGDYFMVQFGHNDATAGVPDRYASPADYKEYLRLYVDGARQRGATPILVTPVNRLDVTGTVFNESFPEYVAKMKELAAEENVALVDLSKRSRDYLNSIGPDTARSVFLHVPAGVYPAWWGGAADNTHFQEYGAIQMARLVATGVKELGLGLSALVKEIEVPAEVPAKPAGLVAGGISNAGALLKWTAVEGADIYKVYRDGALATTSTIAQAELSGLAEGTTYQLTVVAVNGRGDSAASDPLAITTRRALHRYDFGPATAPVMAGYTQVTRATIYTKELGYGLVDSANMIDRDRGAGLDDLGRDFVAYFGGTYEFRQDLPNGLYGVKVHAGDLIGSSRTNVSVEGAAAVAVNASRAVATRSFTGVRVLDGQLNVVITGQTGHLNGLEITPVLTAPAGLAAGELTFDGTSVTVPLSWSATEGAATYTVYRDGEKVGSTAQTSYTDDKAEIGAVYSYTVTGVDPTGAESVPSPAVNVSAVDPAVTPPATPERVRVGRVAKTSVDLRWRPVEGALLYRVFRAEKQAGPYEKIASVTGPELTDSGVLTTVPFHYKVAAVNRGGESAASAVVASPARTTLRRQMERLDRAPVAVRTAQGVYLGWRLLGRDDEDETFAIYRDGRRVAEVRGATNYVDPLGTAASKYRIGDGREFGVWSHPYLDIPLDKPADDYTRDGQPHTYVAGDASVGDLDGDGVYELILKWDPSNAKDNSQAGYTGNVFVDAYRLTGERLWRISMGKNIRAGAHYTQLVVYDLNSDGRAEVMLKTADGTVDGAGTVIGNPSRDHRNSSGYVLSGPEHLSVFEGTTGKVLDTVDYVPARGDVAAWGDAYGNRVDRFLAGVAYLDGEHPTAIFSRGYYTRTVLGAWDFDGSELKRRWVFDSSDVPGYAGQGNHNLSVADVDGDQKDEIVFGSMTVDDDGEGLYTTGLGHGDALHAGDLDPARPGLEVFAAHEDMGSSGNRGATFRDAATGEVLWSLPATKDTGRAASGDIDPRHAGAEGWAVVTTGEWNSREGQLRSAAGELIGSAIPAANFLAWWDGDPLREIVDHDWDGAKGVGTISKWDHLTGTATPLVRAEGTLSNNGTKGTPALQADLFGDWREEIVWRGADSTFLRLFTTVDPTATRIHTLMHDPVYRLGVAWQNVGYNQPPHTGFFIGEGMSAPAGPRIEYTR